MSIRKHGSKPTPMVLQPGWTVDFTFDGTIAGTAQFHVDEDKAFDNKLKFGQGHPKYDKLKVINFRLTQQTTGNCVYDVQYFGLEQNPSRPIYSYYSSLSEEPIETHPDFESDIAGTLGSELNNANFSPATGEFLGFSADAPNNLGGVKGYLTGTPVIRKTWYTTNVYKGLEDIGEIYKLQSNTIPGLSSQQDALKTNWSSRPIGLNFYELSEEYMLSGVNGWNDLIYSQADNV